MNDDMYNKCQTMFRRFIRDDSGATAIEYGMLTAILAVGIIVGVGGIAIVVTNMWDGVDSNIVAT